MNNNSNTPMMGQLTVEDPDEFNRRQRFKEIHDARQRVVEAMAGYDEIHEGDLGKVPHCAMSKMSNLVALYVIELLPLLEQLDDGLAYGSDRFPERFATNDLGHFAMSMGLTNKTRSDHVEPPGMIETMRVFQVANRAFAEMGMDLDLSDGNQDASFSYEDLLDDDKTPNEPPEIPAKE